MYSKHLSVSILLTPIYHRPNIPISALDRFQFGDYSERKLPDLNDHTPYIPPHPQRGTKYHRYALFLLPQPPKQGWSYSVADDWILSGKGETASQHLDIPPVADANRLGFDVREFVQNWGLDLVEGGGAHMWREVWSPTVSKVYKNILRKSLSIFFPVCLSLLLNPFSDALCYSAEQPEPRYGLRPKADRYADVKRTKRYI
jgi:large subunit ribosomal protein L35